MMQPEVDTMAYLAASRYLVGQNIAGVWTTMTSRVKYLYENPAVCLLALIDGVETRVPVGITPSLPDDAKVYMQDGSSGNAGAFGEVGYISGANFKRFLWGEIGTATYVDLTPLTDPNTGKKYSHINEDGLTGWITPGETIEVRTVTTGDAPTSQLQFNWRVQSGPITLEPGDWKTEAKITFTGGAGEFATVTCTVSHRYNQDLTPQAPRLLLMGTATAPWE